MRFPRVERLLVALALLLVLASFVFSCGGPVKRKEGWKRTVFQPGNLGVTVVWRQQITERDLRDYLEYEPLEDGIPGVDDTSVYVGGRSKTLYKLDRHTGEIIQKRRMLEEIFSQPVPIGERLYFGTSTGFLYALQKDSLKTVWKYNAKSEIVTPPIVLDDMLYFITQNDKLVALRADDGSFAWEHKENYWGTMSIRKRAQPAISGDFLYQGFTNGFLCAFDRHNGELLWRRSLGKGKRFDDVNATPVLSDGMLYTASFDNGAYCLNAESGIVLWHTPLKSASAPFLSGNILYLAASEDGFYALDKETGKIRWFMELAQIFHGRKEGALSSVVPYMGNYLVFSASGTGLYFMDFGKKKLIERFTPGNGISCMPTVKGNMIYVLSNGGYVYAISLARKSMIKQI